MNPKGWADPERISTEEIQKRISYAGKITILNGLPRNPVGRTGMVGRGLLGNWGPNYAANPMVTRLNPVDKRLELVRSLSWSLLMAEEAT